MTLEQIKADSLAKGAKFFTPESKAAYKTRYSKRTAAGPGGVFFVTSEEIPTASGVPERRFAVRSFNPVSGEVTLISALGQYATDYAAHVAAKSLATPVEPEGLPEHAPEAPPAVAVTTPVEVAPVAPANEPAPVEAPVAAAA